MKKIIIALFILCCFSTAFAQDVDLLWKARALQASEKMENFLKQSKKVDSKKARIEMMVESAYAMIIAMPDITVKKTPAIVVYHLILNYGEDGILDVAYLYDVKTYEYYGMRVDRLPKNRGIVFLKGKQLGDFLTISNYEDTKEPMIMFSKSDPFNTLVLE